jgi:hypothetical protein
MKKSTSWQPLFKLFFKPLQDQCIVPFRGGCSMGRGQLPSEFWKIIFFNNAFDNLSLSEFFFCPPPLLNCLINFHCDPSFRILSSQLQITCQILYGTCNCNFKNTLVLVNFRIFSCNKNIMQVTLDIFIYYIFVQQYVSNFIF